MRLNFGAERLDFQDNGSNNTDVRDRTEYDVDLRAGDEFVPGTAVFVVPRATLTSYGRKIDEAAGRKQDSNGYGVLFGLSRDVTGVVFAEAGAGVLTRRFEEESEGGDRDDTTFDTGLRVRYLINRNWIAGFNLGYQDRSSNLDGENFRKTVISVRIGMQL